MAGRGDGDGQGGLAERIDVLCREWDSLAHQREHEALRGFIGQLRAVLLIEEMREAVADGCDGH